MTTFQGVTFRTEGPWGPGAEDRLTPLQRDQNFWSLLTRIVDLEEVGIPPQVIESFTVDAQQFIITLTDETVLGPFPLALGVYRWRGDWTPATAYEPLDMVLLTGAGVYVVLVPHTSAANFNANAQQNGALLYQLRIALPPISELTSVRVVTTTHHTLQSPDANTLLLKSGGSVVLPSQANVALPVGTDLAVRQVGSAPVEINRQGGVALHPVEGRVFATAHQGAVVHLKKIAADAWDIWGDLSTGELPTDFTPTEPVSEPTETETEAPTEIATEIATAPTETETEPATEPTTEPTTELPTEPATEEVSSVIPWDDVTVQMVADRMDKTHTSSTFMAAHGQQPWMINRGGRQVSDASPPPGHTKHFFSDTAGTNEAGLRTVGSALDLEITPGVSGPFNVEMTFRYDEGVTTDVALFGGYMTGSNPLRWGWWCEETSGNISLHFHTMDDDDLLQYQSTDFHKGEWYHLALSRDSDGWVRMFVDGVMVDKAHIPEFPVVDLDGLVAFSTNGAHGVRCSWTNFRYVNGKAIYDSDGGHEVPDGPFESGEVMSGDPLWEQVMLLIPSGIRPWGSQQRFSLANEIMARGSTSSFDVVADPTLFERFSQDVGSNFGQGRLHGVPDETALALNGSGLTAEVWVYFDSVRSNTSMAGGVGHYVTSDNQRSWHLGLNVAGGEVRPHVLLSTDGSSFTELLGSGTLSLETWYLLTLSFDPETLIARLFLDGQMVAKETLSGVLFDPDTFMNYTSYNAQTAWNGLFYDSVRVTRACRYKSDSGFLPPTGPWPHWPYQGIELPPPSTEEPTEEEIEGSPLSHTDHVVAVAHGGTGGEVHAEIDLGQADDDRHIILVIGWGKRLTSPDELDSVVVNPSGASSVELTRAVRAVDGPSLINTEIWHGHVPAGTVAQLILEIDAAASIAVYRAISGATEFGPIAVASGVSSGDEVTAAINEEDAVVLLGAWGRTSNNEDVEVSLEDGIIEDVPGHSIKYVFQRGAFSEKKFGAMGRIESTGASQTLRAVADSTPSGWEFTIAAAVWPKIEAVTQVTATE